MAITSVPAMTTATRVVSVSTTSQLMPTVLVAAIVYYVVRSIYRLYLSPLAKFPGPKLAALTGLYEIYYDVILDGKYTFKIMDLHKQYGPIIRITPYQIHIQDTEFYNELYSRNGKWNKTSGFCRAFGNPLSGFATEDHDIHRVRKAALAPFFSKRNVVLLTPVIQEKIEKFCQRLQGIRDNGEVVELHCAYDAMATDVVTEYAMCKSYNYLDVPDFLPAWHYTLVEMTRMLHITKQIPWIVPIMLGLPDKVVKWLNPGLGYMVAFQNDLAGQVTKLMETKDDEVKTKTRPTIMYELLHSEILPPQEKTFQRLLQEGQSIVGGGGDTIANVMATTSYYLIANPDKLAKLKAVLNEAMPNPLAPPNLLQLEKLPYLTGVVQEGLRLSYGVATRLMRIAPDRPIIYKQWSIPAGTGVGMTSVALHHDESVFPDSHSFIPERWIADDGTNNATTPDGRRLDKYMVSFTRGTRQCLGINLAYAELYMCLATVFRRFDLELFETTADDVVLKYDWFLPHPTKGTKGVRVKVVR